MNTEEKVIKFFISLSLVIIFILICYYLFRITFPVNYSFIGLLTISILIITFLKDDSYVDLYIWIIALILWTCYAIFQSFNNTITVFAFIAYGIVLMSFCEVYTNIIMNKINRAS